LRGEPQSNVVVTGGCQGSKSFDVSKWYFFKDQMINRRSLAEVWVSLEIITRDPLYSQVLRSGKIHDFQYPLKTRHCNGVIEGKPADNEFLGAKMNQLIMLVPIIRKP
jgi:hypothetical protein